MMAKPADALFLLEVLVDKIVFVKSPCFSDKDFRTCVNVECPAVAPLEICDDDPGSCSARSGGPFVKTFNAGKSCLFSLQEADITNAMSKFPVQVTVYKSLPCGCLPTKIIMGEATIDMTKEFVASRNKYLEDPTNVSYEALKDSFRIVGPDKTETGEIVMFLRISCFGKLIVTRFQGATGLPNLGAGGQPPIVDRSCFPRKDYQTTDAPCVCGAAQEAGGPSGSKPCKAPCKHDQAKGQGICLPAPDPYNSMPCEDADDPCYCSGPRLQKPEPKVCRNMDQYCLHVPKDCCPTGNKIIFQMPSDTCAMNHKQRAHFNYTCDGVGDVSREEPGQLASPTSEDYRGVVYDYSEQVIKLRIGKVIEMPGRKSKMEYQFFTPAMTHEKRVPVKETRTAQCIPCCSDCCSSKPAKRILPTLPFIQDKKEDPIIKHNRSFYKEDNSSVLRIEFWKHYFETTHTLDEYLLPSLENLDLPKTLFQHQFDLPSNLSCTENNRTKNLLSPTSVLCTPRFNNKHFFYPFNNLSIYKHVFRNEVTTVYMALFNNSDLYRTSGTQATATVNKCLQVTSPHSKCDGLGQFVSSNKNSNLESMYCTSGNSNQNNKYYLPGELTHSDIYYFGKKRYQDKKDDVGMGLKLKPHRSSTGCSCRSSTSCVCKSSKVGKKSEKISPKVKTENKMLDIPAGTDSKKGKGNSASGKSVSIKENPSIKQGEDSIASPSDKQDLIATVSHIQIGPKEPCPYYGMAPCLGPKCLVATPGQDEQAPVKVSTVTNPRRGVFELVIRRITGAPLAKNELMLEWTPPPSRQSPCGAPYPTFCTTPVCRPSKCRIIPCRGYPCRLYKYCKKPCSVPCRSFSCRIKSCRVAPCRIKPCWPVPYRPAPCRPTPCRTGPCRPSPCRPSVCRPSPCRPSPCRPSLWRPSPCRPLPCSLSPCRISPCRPVPCQPKACRLSPCQPSPCRALACQPSPCQPSPCQPTPCELSPCLLSPCRPSPCGPSFCGPSPCGPSPCGPSPCGPSPCRPSPCGPSPCRPSPCKPSQCRPSPCRPSPCRTLLCRRLPCRAAPCRASPCRRSPCRPSPCRRLLCRPAPCGPSPCRRLPCRPTPCRPSPCRPSPCRPSPCRKSPCRLSPCRPSACLALPCQTSPCLPLTCGTSLCQPAPCRRRIPPIYILSARPSMTCKKCCRPCPSPPCGADCGQSCGFPCGPPCDLPCGLPCSSPCAPPCGAPCDSPCASPCGISPCGSPPCKSSPCLRPCPVGYRKPRKARSQPKIKAHRQRISSCHNRSINCPVPRCRSGPCIKCCGTLSCSARRCSSVVCCSPQKCAPFPFKPICYKSACSVKC